MEENGLDMPRPNRAPVRGERPVRVPGYPDMDAVAMHGLGIPGLVPMDMSEDDASEDDDSDEDDLNHDEVSACLVCSSHLHAPSLIFVHVNAMSVHGLGIPGRMPMGTSEHDASKDDNTDKDELNHDKVRAHSCMEVRL